MLEDRVITKKSREIALLEQMGFTVPNHYDLENPTDAGVIYQRYISGAQIRANLDYDIDGLVFFVDDTAEREALGDLNHRPKGAVALKFPHEEKVTMLRDVVWQVGNSGRVTPVAHFDVVNLAGAQVTKASLHNVRRFKGLKLSKGCRILVSRRNDVIPMVEANLDENIHIDALG